MEQQNQEAAQQQPPGDPRKHGPETYDGWAVAYVSIMGPMMMGYIGRLKGLHSGRVQLEDAFEYVMQEQPQPGGSVRIARGSPIEFTRGGTGIEVMPTVLFRLDGLTGDDLLLYRVAHYEADKLRQSLKDGPNKIVAAPGGGSRLVGPQGQRIGG